MEHIGKILKNLRLEKGISLEDVQKRTKIHLNILKAIEEDSFINLSPVYIKGFLKIYCKFLGLDPQKYTAGLKPLQAPSVKLSAVEKRPGLFFKSVSKKMRFIKGLKINKKTKLVALVIVLSLIFVVGLFNFGKAVSSRRRLARSKDSPPAKSAAAKTAVSGIRLTILARGNCWITLKADGRVVFHGVLRKGKSETWQAKKKIEFSLSNAGVVDLILNGEKISSLGKKGQARKNILVTKDGLTIP